MRVLLVPAELEKIAMKYFFEQHHYFVFRQHSDGRILQYYYVGIRIVHRSTGSPKIREAAATYLDRQQSHALTEVLHLPFLELADLAPIPSRILEHLHTKLILRIHPHAHCTELYACRLFVYLRTGTRFY